MAADQDRAAIWCPATMRAAGAGAARRGAAETGARASQMLLDEGQDGVGRRAAAGRGAGGVLS